MFGIKFGCKLGADRTCENKVLFKYYHCAQYKTGVVPVNSSRHKYDAEKAQFTTRDAYYLWIYS